jgi:hypothetical protein
VTRQIRTLLFLESAAFAAAALVHSGVLIDGYEHDDARIAESVIAVVLLAGLAWSWVRPAQTREAGIAAQGFALLGTFVGLFTIAIGVGPRTALDVVYHVAIVLVLIWGLRLAMRATAVGTGQHA